MQKILQSNSHIICTMRCKQDYVLSEKNGKMTPEKVGLKAVMREGIDYEFTIVFDINMKHQAVVSKDRTNLFSGKPDFTIAPTTGQTILDWCNDGVNMEMIKNKINQAKPLKISPPFITLTQNGTFNYQVILVREESSYRRLKHTKHQLST